MISILDASRASSALARSAKSLNTLGVYQARQPSSSNKNQAEEFVPHSSSKRSCRLTKVRNFAYHLYFLNVIYSSPPSSSEIQLNSSTSSTPWMLPRRASRRWPRASTRKPSNTILQHSSPLQHLQTTSSNDRPPSKEPKTTHPPFATQIKR